MSADIPATRPSPDRIESSTPPGELRLGGGTVLLLLAPAFLAVGWLVSGVRWIWSNRPEMQFGWIVLVLSAYVFWEKWPARPAARPRLTPFALVGALVGLATAFVVQAYQAALGTGAASICTQALATVLIAFATLHFVFGTDGIRQFGFPFLFLLVAMPPPSAVQSSVTHALQDLIATLNVEGLNLIGIPARRLGSLIQLPGGTVGVNEACSGIRSLQSSIMATLFIGYLTLQSNLLRTLLLGAGLFIAVGGNFIRSFYLSWTAHTHGVASVSQVHDAAGWSILLVTAAGVAAVAWWFARLEKAVETEPPSRPSSSSPASDSLPSASGPPRSERAS